MLEYEKKMEAIRLIAQTLNTMPLYELSDELFEMAVAKDETLIRNGADDEDV